MAFERFYGPAQLPATATTLYTVPAGKYAVIRRIHVSNPSANPVDFTLSVGVDAAGTRMWDDYAIPAGRLRNYGRVTLMSGESIQAYAGTAGTLVVTVDGREKDVSGFHVELTGNDTTGNGSIGQPWRTVKKACDTVTVGTILVGVGTFVESGTCVLADGVSLVGAGSTQTIIRCNSASVSPLVSLANTTQAQTISDLRLDGQARTTGDYGLWAEDVTNLTLTRLDVIGFVGPTDMTGGGINIIGATDLTISYVTMANNASDVTSQYCSGELGLSSITRADIHHLTIVSPQGICVKMSDNYSINTELKIHDSHFEVESSECADTWNNLSVEFWADARGCEFYNNWLNAVLSLPSSDEAPGQPPGYSYRWRIHHNEFDCQPGSWNNMYAIEMGLDYVEIDHNYIICFLYPIAHFNNITQDHVSVHHNVFDYAQGQAACWLDVWQVTNATFEHNTVVFRYAEVDDQYPWTWRDGIFSFGESRTPQYPDDSTLTVDDNIFHAAVTLGDIIGRGVGACTFDGNIFYNLTPTGTNYSTSDSGMPLTGGFPDAYVPTGGAATKGALADGIFEIGPS